MTTAHRPTFDPARGKEALRGPAYHQRLLPAHTQLKTRQPGQGGVADTEARDLRAELLAAEAAHFAKTKGTTPATAAIDSSSTTSKRAPKRELEPLRKATTNADDNNNSEEYADAETKRRRILEETKDIDADSFGSDSGSDQDEEDRRDEHNDNDEDEDEDSEEDSDDEDETAELMRELEKIKKERAEQKAREEAAKAAKEQEDREEHIALGNPLLNPKAFNVKRRWDDDVVFKNQARGTEQKNNKEFVNDLLRSDFHKKFMSKYVR